MGFDRSVLWKDEKDFTEECYKYCEPFNPNPIRKDDVNWLEGVTGDKRRYLPYNGGIGEEQMKWFDNTLQKADENSERVIIASHCQLQQGCSEDCTLLWNYEEA